MTVESIKDAINEQIDEVDSLTHVPAEVRGSLREKLEEVLADLDEVQDTYGDEPADEDPYGDNADDIED